MKLDSGTLEIGNAARDDEGEYKCRVANAAGEQFHTIRLNVTSEHVCNCVCSFCCALTSCLTYNACPQILSFKFLCTVHRNK